MNNINTINVENVTKLVEHYKALPDLASWGYTDCAAGVLENLKIIKSRMNDYEVADALGVTINQSMDIIAGPKSMVWQGLDDIQRRDMVVTMLEGLLENGDVEWPLMAVPK